MREQFYFSLHGNDLGFEIVKMFVNSLLNITMNVTK